MVSVEDKVARDGALRSACSNTDAGRCSHSRPIPTISPRIGCVAALLALALGCGGGATHPRGAHLPPPEPGNVPPPARSMMRGGQPDDATEALRDVVEVEAGTGHTCARTRLGAVWCWGHNRHGEIGDGTHSIRTRPTRVDGIHDATKLALGSMHTCALRASGDVSCWGGAGFAQLGNGMNGLDQPDDVEVLSRPRPGNVVGVVGAIDIDSSALALHTCAITVDRGVVCWGGNDHGQLGDGTRTMHRHPVAVPQLNDVVDIAVGRNHNCALEEAGIVKCWGGNYNGQLGNGTTPPYPSAPASPAPVSGLTDAVEIVAGGDTTCARRRTEEIACWGTSLSTFRAEDLVPSPIRVRANPGALSIGDLFACILDQRGAVCWGTTATPQLGMTITPEVVADTEGAVELGLGLDHMCIIDGHGSVRCWGANDVGQLGNGEIDDSYDEVPEDAHLW